MQVRLRVCKVRARLLHKSKFGRPLDLVLNDVPGDFSRQGQWESHKYFILKLALSQLLDRGRLRHRFGWNEAERDLPQVVKWRSIRMFNGDMPRQKHSRLHNRHKAAPNPAPPQMFDISEFNFTR